MTAVDAAVIWLSSSRLGLKLALTRLLLLLLFLLRLLSSRRIAACCLVLMVSKGKVMIRDMARDMPAIVPAIRDFHSRKSETGAA